MEKSRRLKSRSWPSVAEISTMVSNKLLEPHKLRLFSDTQREPWRIKQARTQVPSFYLYLSLKLNLSSFCAFLNQSSYPHPALFQLSHKNCFLSELPHRIPIRCCLCTDKCCHPDNPHIFLNLEHTDFQK
jgi:hypothetical protein